MRLITDWKLPENKKELLDNMGRFKNKLYGNILTRKQVLASLKLSPDLALKYTLIENGKKWIGVSK